MAARELELRVAKLETEMIQVKQKIEAVAEPAKPWWQEIYGTFANDPLYEEAMRLGRAYRESSRPNARRKKGGLSWHELKPRSNLSCA